MSRTIPSSIINTLDDEVVRPFFAVELNFDNDPLRLWTGLGELSYDSKVWTGAGDLIAISSVEETSETAAKGASITITGIPSAVLALALTTPYQGRTCRIYFGMLDSSDAVIDLFEMFSGYMDQMSINESSSTGTIQVTAENKLIDLERARTARFTSAYQRSRNISGASSDKGFDFVNDLQDQKLPWGRSADT
jgi:hypothetical protein